MLHFGHDRAAAHGFFHAACSKNAFEAPQAGEMLKISRDAEKFVCITANTVVSNRIFNSFGIPYNHQFFSY